MDYPHVVTEEATIEVLVSGQFRGMARYGDGDFNVLRGRPDRFHRWEPGLAAAIARSLADPAPGVLQCLIPPPEFQNTLASQRWIHYQEANAGIIPFLRIGSGGWCGSANVSRMDSCPRLHTSWWWDRVSELWKGKDICLVYGTERSLTPKKLLDSPNSPRSVTSVSCAAINNFAEIEQLGAKVLIAGREIVILCAGMSARPLVHQLVRDGMNAYDLGHFGQWFDQGQPIPLAECIR